MSIDYNNTLNVERAGLKQLDRIEYNAGEAIRVWLKRSESYRVGICSYIGLHGEKSRERRIALKIQVKLLNRWLYASGYSGIPEERFVTFCITSDRLKPILRRDTVTAHLDDKWQVIDKVLNNRASGGVYVSKGLRKLEQCLHCGGLPGSGGPQVRAA